MTAETENTTTGEVTFHHKATHWKQTAAHHRHGGHETYELTAMNREAAPACPPSGLPRTRCSACVSPPLMLLDVAADKLCL